MMPEPMLSSETPKPTPARAENALTVTGNRVGDPCELRGEEERAPTRPATPTIANADLPRLRPARVEHDERLAGGDAVGEAAASRPR